MDLSSFERVLGVLAGEDGSTDWLARWARSSDHVVAADGAADRLVLSGVTPDLAIGDFDSIRATNTGFPRLHIADQESSDCDKLLAYVFEHGAKSLTLIGIEGDRPDHVLASLFSAARSDLDVRIAFRSGLGWVVRPDRPREIETTAGALVSFLPLSECRQVRFHGVAWALDEEVLHPLGRVSLSNRAEADRVRIEVGEGRGLLFVGADGEPIWP